MAESRDLNGDIDILAPQHQSHISSINSNKMFIKVHRAVKHTSKLFLTNQLQCYVCSEHHRSFNFHINLQLVTEKVFLLI